MKIIEPHLVAQQSLEENNYFAGGEDRHIIVATYYSHNYRLLRSTAPM